jgi:hyperosmotically inducible protein
MEGSGRFDSHRAVLIKVKSDFSFKAAGVNTPDTKATLASRAFIAGLTFHLEFIIRRNMKKLRLSVAMLALLAIGILAGCSQTATKSPDVSDSIRKSLDQAGFKDVTVSQDRDKGIVTLGGQVASENDKSQAESLAKSLAGVQVVADQIAVIPVGAEKEAKAVNSDLDQGIEKNLDAALIQNKLHKSVKYEVKNGVVTLTGEVNSENKRALAEKVATGVPNVTQVVNDLQVKNQKASSSQ